MRMRFGRWHRGPENEARGYRGHGRRRTRAANETRDRRMTRVLIMMTMVMVTSSPASAECAVEPTKTHMITRVRGRSIAQCAPLIPPIQRTSEPINAREQRFSGNTHCVQCELHLNSPVNFQCPTNKLVSIEILGRFLQSLAAADSSRKQA